MASAIHDHEKVRELVRQGYGQIAVGGCCSSSGPVPITPGRASTAGGCCGAAVLTPHSLAREIGYSVEELSALPDGANLGLSCGNPTAIAALRPGEVVLDLGSGGGFDAFLAGPKVGPAGRAIGVDMTSEMLARARQNLTAYHRQTGLDNVEFRLGEIEHLPVADASVDVVISNCVINLSPDKPQVWREIARVLKPGGRVAVSDLALLQPLPDDVRQMVAALVGCVAGAALVEEVRQMVAQAGLVEITLQQRPEYIRALLNFEDPLYRQIAAHLPAGATAADYVTSLTVEARKTGMKDEG